MAPTAKSESAPLNFSCALHEKTDVYTVVTIQITLAAQATFADERGVEDLHEVPSWKHDQGCNINTVTFERSLHLHSQNSWSTNTFWTTFKMKSVAVTLLDILLAFAVQTHFALPVAAEGLFDTFSPVAETKVSEERAIAEMNTQPESSWERSTLQTFEWEFGWNGWALSSCCSSRATAHPDCSCYLNKSYSSLADFVKALSTTTVWFVSKLQQL